MNGKVFTGHVVRNKTVQAGDGVTTGVVKSEVVYSTNKPIIAQDAQSAKNIILALAARQDSKLDLESSIETLEVVVVTAG